MLRLGAGEAYDEALGWDFTSGSRAEGLTLENDWGHEAADVDEMYMHGGRLGVHVAAGKQPRGKSSLDFRPEGCPPAHCKLEISDLDGLRESRVFGEKWFADSCIEKSGNKKWLNTYNTVRCMKDSFSITCDKPVSGPASQSSGSNLNNTDIAHTLVCSSHHPDLHHEFCSRT